MKEKKGFSLIEIIVAIAIIAVLAGAIVPVMFNRLDQARYIISVSWAIWAGCRTRLPN